eukprot:scaffold147_cov376-Prasinococcus_capsulatus_cf.AAC.1
MVLVRSVVAAHGQVVFSRSVCQARSRIRELPRALLPPGEGCTPQQLWANQYNRCKGELVMSGTRAIPPSTRHCANAWLRLSPRPVALLKEQGPHAFIGADPSCLG